jgi:hypothetical protein
LLSSRRPAFIFQQDTARTSPVTDHLVTVDTVERRTGLNLFWELVDVEEDALEAASNATWASSWVN